MVFEDARPPLPSVPAKELNIVWTSSTHLAAFLYTCGIKPSYIQKGPERNPQGIKITKWFFEGSPDADDIMKRWQTPNRATRDWQQLNNEERDILVNCQTIFSDNLKAFIAEAKKQ